MTTLIDLGKLRFSYSGIWLNSTQYELNDCVAYGGNVYAYTSTTATTGNLPTNANYWTLMVEGFNWRGNWATGTAYKVHDVVFSGISSYLVLNTYTSSGSVATDVANGNLTFLAVGAADILPTYAPVTNAGQSLQVNSAGTAIEWKGATAATYNLYVSPNGNDANDGKNISNAKASIQAAVAAVPPGGAPIAIHVQAGTYTELLLPIVVPQNVSIIGASTRTTIVQPGGGLAADGVTPNAQSTMWALSDGSMLNKMTFQGMTGWVPGVVPSNIVTSTPKGIFCALNPASPVIIKSPYVIECSCFSNGGIGAYVNGSVHTTGNRSILFHEYTGIHNDGVGIWVDNNGKSEAVGVFTYFCYFGYATTNGGQLRSISGNNSYGTYGSYSSGFNASETVTTGSIYGTMITLTGAYTGTINVGDTVTSSSGGTATVTSAQVTSIYVTGATGTFNAGNTLTFTSGGQGVVSSYGGQSGFLLVLNNLTALPQVGQSIQISGDSSAYIISNVSGTYSGLSSVIQVVTAQQIPTAEADGAAVTLRSQFSLCRITAHDFLNIGTGGTATTNYPGTPSQLPNPANQVIQSLPGRVYYTSTDQQGNFAVGSYFAVNQATGAATLNANSFNLSGLTSLRLGSIGAQLGAQINEFSTDGTMSQNSPVKVPTQSAVVTYVGTATNKIVGNSAFQQQTGTAFTAQFSVFSNVSATVSLWSLTGTVPTGISINSSGLVTGTTAVATGSYSFTVNALLGDGTTLLTKAITWVANPQVPLFGSGVLPATVPPSTAFTSTATQATAVSGTVVHTVTAGSIPSWLTLNSNGTLTGTAPATPIGYAGPFTFTVTATNGTFVTTKSFIWTYYLGLVQGQAAYTSPGTYSWVAPAAVTSVSVVAVGGGGAGQDNWANPCGAGGGLGWKNNITVVPGTAYTVVVGAGGTSTSSAALQLLGGNSYFISTSTVAGYGGGNASYGNTGGPNANGYGGGYFGDGGGAGGNATSYDGGGGAGGYTGRGGNNQSGYAPSPTNSGGGGGGGYYSSTYGTGAGGGVGINGQGITGDGSNFMYNPFQGYNNSYGNGSGGAGGSGGTNGYYGENPFSGQGQSSSNIQGGTYGGGGGGPGTSWPSASGNGGGGAVRIIWGTGRAYPATNTADVTPSGP